MKKTNTEIRDEYKETAKRATLNDIRRATGVDFRTEEQKREDGVAYQLSESNKRSGGIVGCLIVMIIFLIVAVYIASHSTSNGPLTPAEEQHYEDVQPWEQYF